MPRRAPLILILLLGLLFAPAASAQRHRALNCGGPYTAYRDPANPLLLPHAPGADPLHGAPLFIDGPRHGVAAGAIVRLLHLSPTQFADSYSWARLSRALRHGALARRLRHNRRLARAVARLAMIASQPEENRFSLYSGGGGPGAVFSQVRGFLCHTMAADPGTVPILTTYFLYQAGYCESAGTIRAHRARFRRQVNEFARAVGRHPAVVLLELDAIGSARCMERTGALRDWEADISYEIGRVAALPHTVAYVEGGYADGNPVGWTVRALRAVGVGRIRGFFTNDTHNDWTMKEIRWGTAISRATRGAHFIVNTSSNGRGPLLNAHPARQGVEDLCNAPGRGLGPPPTTSTGFPRVDAFLWTVEPGESAGSCRGGPPPGLWWAARAIGLAARASARLGP